MNQNRGWHRRSRNLATASALLFGGLAVGLLGALAGCSLAPRGPCEATTPLGTVCGFSNPEDVDSSELGWEALACANNEDSAASEKGCDFFVLNDKIS